VTEFADGLNIPIGVYPFRSPGVNGRDTWKALVWSIPHIWLLEDTDGDGKADRREPWYGPFDHTRDTHGNQASFRRGFDGWMYATHGFNNDSHVTGRDGNRVDLNSGNTYRVRLDGSRIEHHTWGQVNPFGLTWDHRGNLYSSDCHSAPLYQLLAGGYYPSFGKPHDGLGYAPVLMEHAHGSTAIDGACYYSDDLWPEAYRDTLLIGNVMTSRLNRDRIEFDGSSPRAVEQPDFLTSTDSWFRPVDTCLGPDGALYIADFYNRIIGHYEVPLQHPGRDRERGRIWRVVHVGDDGQARLRGPGLPVGLEGLLEELASPSLTRRLLAMGEIEDRFALRALAPLREAVANPRNSTGLVHALWLIHRLRALKVPDLQPAFVHPDPLVRVHAMRIGADVTYRKSRGLPLAPGLAVEVMRAAREGLTDPDALVRRCAAETLGSGPEAASIDPMLLALAEAGARDTHLVYVLRKSLRDHLRVDGVASVVLLRKDLPEAGILALADVALAVNSPAASSFLLRHFNRFADGKGPAASEVLQHAARHAVEEDLQTLVGLVEARFASDHSTRFSLFQSVEKGLQLRGLALPTAVREWGAGIVSNRLTTASPSQTWLNHPLPGAPTANPWDMQERGFEDGSRGAVISSFPHGETLTGILRSAPFAAPARLTFWLCGHDGYPDKPAQGKNRLRLRDATTDAVLREVAPPRSDVAKRMEWDLAELGGRPVTLEATDGDTAGAFAWLAFGRLEPALPQLAMMGPRSSAQQFAAAADAAARLGLREHQGLLLATALERQADPEARLGGARAALALEPETAAAGLIPQLLDPAQPEAWREALGDLLGSQRIPAARTALLATFRSAPQRVQNRWAVSIASTPDGAAALLESIEKADVPARVLQAGPVRDRLRSARVPDWEARIQRATSALPPADAARDRLISARRNSWESLAGKARAKEGERLFQTHCAACHQVEGQGGLVGPQLTGIGNRGVERLCEDILDPNRNVDHAFRQTLITLRSGDSLSGLFRRDDGTQVILANALGAEIAVPRDEIVERRESELSLMPDNFGDALSEEEFTHLLAYLLAQRGK
jgi:putative heme-binding domain-containing protein